MVQICDSSMRAYRPTSAEAIAELDRILAELQTPRRRYNEIVGGAQQEPVKPKTRGFGFSQNVRNSRNNSPRVAGQTQAPTLVPLRENLVLSPHAGRRGSQC